jgi:hypothetical protein
MDTKIDLSRPYVIRLSLYNIATVRKDLIQPYDPNFQCAMVLTMNDLLIAFQPRTGYANLHDILLVFDQSRCNISPSSTKLVTLFTSYATVRFNHHFASQLHNEAFKGLYPKTKLQSALSKQIVFYGSLVQMDSTRLSRYVINRCRDKALGLAIYMYAQSYFTQEQLQTKTPNDIVQMLAIEKQIQWYRDIPLFLSYGVFAKLDRIDSNDLNTIKNRRPTNRAIILTDDHEATFRLMISDYWNDTINDVWKGELVRTESFYQIAVVDEPRELVYEPESPPFYETVPQHIIQQLKDNGTY